MYYVVYGLLYAFSLLPLQVLYLFSDLTFFLIYYVLGYRKKIVTDNLLLSFPEKTARERRRIAKKFYRNLTDTFIESIKMISVSKKFIQKHFLGNWEVINQYYSTGRSVQLHIGHNFNWEWGNAAAAKQLKFRFLAVYMPITNKIFERLFYKLRSESGSILLPATNMREAFLPYRNSQYMLGLATDQNPGNPQNAWWFNFLGRPTPFVKGPEKGARLNNTIVIFAFIHKLKRGYYEAVFTVGIENPADLPETELTKKFVHYLEDVVKKYPDMWLWSHRRWKHEWKEEYGEIINKKS